MVSAILALLVALAPAVLEILKVILQQREAKGITNAEMARRSVDELHAATDGVLDTHSSVQP